jgi:hypothetical protein
LTAIGDKSWILYPGISIAKEIYCDFKILKMAPFYTYYGSYIAQSLDGGVTKWRMLILWVQSRQQKWRWKTGKKLS